jgi:hypothetical protein
MREVGPLFMQRLLALYDDMHNGWRKPERPPTESEWPDIEACQRYFRTIEAFEVNGLAIMSIYAETDDALGDTLRWSCRVKHDDAEPCERKLICSLGSGRGGRPPVCVPSPAVDLAYPRARTAIYLPPQLHITVRALTLTTLHPSSAPPPPRSKPSSRRRRSTVVDAPSLSSTSPPSTITTSGTRCAASTTPRSTVPLATSSPTI